MAKSNTLGASLVLGLLVMAIFLNGAEAAGRGGYPGNIDVATFDKPEIPFWELGPWARKCLEHPDFCLWHLPECHFCIDIPNWKTTTQAASIGSDHADDEQVDQTLQANAPATIP